MATRESERQWIVTKTPAVTAPTRTPPWWWRVSKQICLDVNNMAECLWFTDNNHENILPSLLCQCVASMSVFKALTREHMYKSGLSKTFLFEKNYTFIKQECIKLTAKTKLYITLEKQSFYFLKMLFFWTFYLFYKFYVSSKILSNYFQHW